MSELYEAVLGPAELEALRTDLATCVVGLRAQVRGSRGVERVPVDEAFRRLDAAEVHALQVQYQHEGIEWRDTLTAVDAGLRLVRARLG